MEPTPTATTASTVHVADVVTAESMGGVMNEITSLLPIVLPVMIGFIAIRKGISFLTRVLHSA